MNGDVVLALDLGIRTGYASSCGKRGAFKFIGLKGHDTTMRHGHLGWRFCGWLGDLLVETEASLVVVERTLINPRVSSGERRLVPPGLRMLALSACWGHERAVEEVSPATWKAWSRNNLPEHVKSDENDARAILAWWQAVRAPAVFGEAA